MNYDNRVMLRGVLPHTASCVAIDDAGSLVVELYDFSTDAHTWLGNDVAFLLTVGAAGKADALARLLGDRPPPAAERDALLLQLLAARFVDYHGVLQWLEEQRIPFRKEFEPLA